MSWQTFIQIDKVEEFFNEHIDKPNSQIKVIKKSRTATTIRQARALLEKWINSKV